MNHLALTRNELDGVTSGIGLPFTAPGQVVSAATPYFFYIAGFAMGIYIVLSGFAVMNSKGDPRALEAAKAKLTYAILGFFIVFASYWIVQIVGIVFNIQAIKDIF